MKLAKIVFIAAGAWGIVTLAPLFFLVDVTGHHYTPPTTYPQFLRRATRAVHQMFGSLERSGQSSEL